MRKNPAACDNLTFIISRKYKQRSSGMVQGRDSSGFLKPGKRDTFNEIYALGSVWEFHFTQGGPFLMLVDNMHCYFEAMSNLINGGAEKDIFDSTVSVSCHDQ